MSKTTATEVLKAIRETDRFLITSHLRADGDAIASVCFAAALLKKLGRNFWIVLDDIVPDKKYDFLENFDLIHTVDALPGDFDPENLFVLDTPTFERLGRVADLIPDQGLVINIDHHISNQFIGTLNLVEPDASSTCEILYQFMQESPDLTSEKTAEMIYTGICFDTGRFRFSNTSPNALRVSAEMVACGIDVETISDRLFYRWSPLRARIMGKLLNHLMFKAEGRVAITILQNDFFSENPGGWQELEGFSDLGVAINGVEIAIFLKELKPDNFKISLRSKGEHDVGAIAAKFGGGGHAKAAGCEIQGKVNSVIDRLEKAFAPEILF